MLIFKEKCEKPKKATNLCEKYHQENVGLAKWMSSPPLWKE
jgi:hypothetical protein